MWALTWAVQCTQKSVTCTIVKWLIRSYKVDGKMQEK